MKYESSSPLQCLHLTQEPYKHRLAAQMISKPVHPIYRYLEQSPAMEGRRSGSVLLGCLELVASTIPYEELLERSVS